MQLRLSGKKSEQRVDDATADSSTGAETFASQNAEYGTVNKRHT